MPNLYTFIMDHLGGTYVSQIIADDEQEAANKWLEQLDVTDINGLSTADKAAQLETGFNDDHGPVLLKNLTNAWCIDMSTEKGLAVITFIRTVN